MNKVFSSILFIIIAFSELFSQDFNGMLEKAKSENKRVIINIYTDWCTWCRKMDTEVYGDTEIRKLIQENFVVAKLNAEGSAKVIFGGKEYTEEDLAVYFDATGYPTTVFLEPDGTLIQFSYDKHKMKSLPGYFKSSDFKKMLQYIRDGKYKDTDLSTVL